MTGSKSTLDGHASTGPTLTAGTATHPSRPAVADTRAGASARPRSLRIAGTIRSLARRRVLVDVLAIAALAALMRVLFAHAEPDTDPTFALIWGHDIIHGHLPDFAFASGPTAHPLPTVESTLVAVLGRTGAVTATLVTSYACLGAVQWGTFRLGQAMFSWPVGLLATVLVGTNFGTVDVGLGAFLDVQFIALLVWAAVLELRRPRRGAIVLSLLVLAGTLRPEAWLLTAAYGLYAFRGRRRVAAGLAVLAAPLAWIVMDTIVTGHPLFAFTNAQQSTEAVALGQSNNSGLVSFAVSLLRTAMRAPVLLGGTFGFLLAWRFRFGPSKFPGAILVLLLLVFTAFVVLRLPVPNRMLLTPATLFAVFCVFAALGALGHPPGMQRGLWAVGGAALLAVLIATAPAEISRLRNLDRRRAVIEQAIGDLVALNRQPAPRAALASCRTLSVGAPSLVPYTAYYLDRPLQQMRLVSTGVPAGGAYLALATRSTSSFVLGYKPEAGTRVPTGFRRVADNRSWRLYARGC